MKMKMKKKVNKLVLNQHVQNNNYDICFAYARVFAKFSDTFSGNNPRSVCKRYKISDYQLRNSNDC